MGVFTNYKDPEEELQGQLDNYYSRFAHIGLTAPEPEKKSNLLLGALDVLDRPRNALVSGLAGKGFTKGLTGEVRTNVSDLIGDNVKNKYLRTGLGFAGDVLLDPLTYLTLGTAGVAKGAATGVARQALGQGTKRTALKFAGLPIADVTPVVSALRKGYEASRIPNLIEPVFNTKYINKDLTSVEELPFVQQALDTTRETQRLIKGQQQEALDFQKKAYAGMTDETAQRAAHIIEAPTQLKVRQAKLATDKLPQPKVVVHRTGQGTALEDMITPGVPAAKSAPRQTIEEGLKLPTVEGVEGAKSTVKVLGLGGVPGEQFATKAPTATTPIVKPGEATADMVMQSVRRGTLDTKDLNKALSSLDRDGQKQLLDSIAKRIQDRLPAPARKALRESQIPKAEFKGQRYSEKQLLAYHKEVAKGIDELKTGVAKYLRDSAKEAAGEGDIWRQIRDRGGIRQTDFYKTEYLEFVPIGLRNKYGLSLDEMADELGMAANDLMQMLGGRKKITGYKISDFLQDANKMLRDDPNYQTKLRAVAKIEELLGKLGPGQVPAEIRSLMPKITKAEDVLKPEVKAQVERFIASPETKPLLEKLQGMINISAVKPAKIKAAEVPKIKNLDLPVDQRLSVAFEKKPVSELAKTLPKTTDAEMVQAARELGYKLTPEGIAAAKIAKRITEQTATRDMAADVAFTELPNYIRHLYKDDWKTVKKVYDAWAKKYGRLPGKLAGFQKERQFPTLIEAKRFAIEELGLEIHPIEDVRVLTAVREMEGIQQRAINGMYQKIKLLGPAVIKSADQAPHGWVQLPVKQLEGMVVHPEVGRFIERFNSTINTDEGIKTFVSALSGVQNFWKGLVTAPNAAFHIRNAMSNVFNNFLGGVVNPAWYAIGAKVQKGGKELVTLNGKQYTAQELRKIFRENGLEGFGFFAGESQSGIVREAREAFEKAPAIKQISPIHQGRKVGDWLESNAKMAHFLDRLNKGDTVKDAADSARKYLFDYGDLTEAEKKIRNFIPFWTFTRKNLPLQIESLITQPGKMTALNKLVQNAQTAQGTQESDLPEWMRSELAIPIGNNRHLLLDLPINQLNMLSGGSETLKNALGMITPLAKVPIELGMGKQIFSGADIEKYPGAKARYGNVEMPAKLAYGLSQLGAVPRSIVDIGSHLMPQQPAQSGSLPPAPENLPVLGSFMRQTNPQRERMLNSLRRKNQLADYVKYLEDVEGIEVPTMTEIKKAKKKRGVFI